MSQRTRENSSSRNTNFSRSSRRRRHRRIAWASISEGVYFLTTKMARTGAIDTRTMFTRQQHARRLLTTPALAVFLAVVNADVPRSLDVVPVGEME